MKYKLEACTISELGQRSNQEDSIFPANGEASGDDRLFILCDGMGGHSSGEVASAAVCEGLGRAVMSLCPDPEGEFSDEDFQKALAAAYDLLDTKDDGATKKMGTTMTFLKLHSEGCTIAHIGDSRVYHIRPGKDKESTEILFQTVDHSLVNDLLRAGELLPEEVKDFKQKNVITRAMQPNMERRCKASLHHICDIRPGDCFLLCSDGILENMEDDNLKFIFSDACGDIANKVDVIRNATAGNRDNHSAIIVHILEVDGQEGGDCAPDCKVAASEGSISPSVEPSSNGSSRKILLAGLAILALIAASFAAGKLLF
ncbi:MAG: PP2C family protein-serine/threonine phosphatase [Candidatus Cryptobacteroides sp.]